VTSEVPEEPPGERPRWSVTWLLRIQRTGRHRPTPRPDDTPQPRLVWRVLPWVVLGALIIEVAILVWLEVIPR
jgi:hypothetical protein